MSVYEKDMFGESKHGMAIKRVTEFCSGKRVLCAFSGGKDSQVWNPARLPGGRSNRWYMARCLIALWQSRRVVALRGWHNSEGARIEVALAHYVGIPVVKK